MLELGLSKIPSASIVKDVCEKNKTRNIRVYDWQYC
jgi:hypothetical protein